MYRSLQRKKEKGSNVYISEKRVNEKSKEKVNEQFGRKMNENMNGNKKLFWKEVSNVKGGKVKRCSRIKVGNERLAQGEDEMQRIWKEYFEDLYNIDTQEQIAVQMYGFDSER